MKLYSLAKNRTVLSFDDGQEVFFSYETPVAGYSNSLGYVKTKLWYSSTTTRHINRYLNEYGDVPNPNSIPTVDQSVINDLLREYIPSRY